MNSTQKRRFFSKINLFILLILSACAPATTATMPAETEIPVADVLITPQVEITEPASVPATAVPPTAEPMPIYPFYLPLATKLENVSQTIDGVTTQIDWVYVDEARVAIAYTISGLDWPDGSSLDGTQQIQIGIPTLANFRFGGFSGGSGGNWTLTTSGRVTATSDQLLLDGALDGEKYPNINLNVAIPVEGPTKIGTFHFNFTAPVADGFKIENIDQTVVTNNVAMTLKSLALTPSRAEALICFQMPSAVDWGLTTSRITVGDREYPFSGGGLATGKADPGSAITAPERCNDLGFDISFDEPITSITLTVPRLQASYSEVVTKEVVDRANQRLADKGIEFNYENVDHGGNIVILKRPDGMTDPEIYPLIWDALSDQYEGPWVFTVEIPK